MNTKKFFVAVFFSVFALLSMGHASVAHASATDNVFGEAWSNDTGWISFNNCTSATSCSGINYGVTMNPVTGNLSGEAWSPNLGWISFNANSTTGCTTQPKINLSTGAFSGFGWAESTNGSGWDGCIALSAADESQTGWGLQANMSTGAITGEAWGGLNTGWIVPQADMKIVSPTFHSGSFIITSSTGLNGTINPLGLTTVSSGASQAYTITPNTGYIATVTVDGSPASETGPNTYTFTNVTATHTISVAFGLPSGCGGPSYTITNQTTDPNGTVTPGTTIVSCTGSQAFTITPNTGYVIASLVVDGSSVPIVSTYTFHNVTANHTISATFAPIPPPGCGSATYTITASSDSNGTVAPPGITTVNCTGSQAYTITPNSGYTIASVTVDGLPIAVASSYTFSNVTANHTISATFAPNPPGGPYTITASSGPNGTVTPPDQTSVTRGGSQSYSITPTTGYTIMSLVVDGRSISIGSSYSFTNVTTNHTISATFSACPIGGCPILPPKGGTGTGVIYIER